MLTPVQQPAPDHRFFLRLYDSPDDVARVCRWCHRDRHNLDWRHDLGKVEQPRLGRVLLFHPECTGDYPSECAALERQGRSTLFGVGWRWVFRPLSVSELMLMEDGLSRAWDAWVRWDTFCQHCVELTLQFHDL